MLREQVLVDPRLVIEPFGIAGRHQLDQVVIPLVGLGEQHQVVGRFADVAALGVPASRRDVDFAAEDRLHAPLLRVVVKNHRRKHVAVLGDRQRGHVQLGGLIERLVDPAGPVEQGIFGVQVKMNESLVSHVWEEFRS